jgi:SAM-dependent methyltransferase
MLLEIGGGTAVMEGYVNLDPRMGEGEFRRRVQDGIPLPDESVEAVRASHVMEHIPAGQERIDVFNEVWRVLVPGGTFHVIVPLFSYGWQAIADPTHVSFWLYESFLYFTGGVMLGSDYGIRLWQFDTWQIYGGWEGHAVLRKP